MKLDEELDAGFDPSTVEITGEVLALVAELVEFKGLGASWDALPRTACPHFAMSRRSKASVIHPYRGGEAYRSRGRAPAFKPREQVFCDEG
jgi:hypothetical protein